MRHDGKGLDKAVAERAVAGHNVLDIAFEDVIYAPAHKAVAEVVEGTLVLGEIGCGKPVSNDHIRLPLQHMPNERGRVVGGVGVVPVGHDVALGLYLLEHTADNIALALLMLIPDYRAGIAGKLGCVVGGVVVIDINDRFGKRGFEVGDDLRYRLRLVIAGNQYGNLIHCSLLVFHF